MKFVNLKTCQGLESYLVLDRGLLRLSMLPETLQKMNRREVRAIVDELRGTWKHLACAEVKVLLPPLLAVAVGWEAQRLTTILAELETAVPTGSSS